MLFYLLIPCAVSLTTLVDRYSQFCMDFPSGRARTLEVEIAVAGYEERNNRMQLTSPIGETLLDEIGLAEYSEEFTLEDEGTYVLCVEALDSYVKVLTFEFYFSHPEIDEALKSDFQEIEQEYATTLTSMMQIYRNQHYLIDREQEHVDAFSETYRRLLNSTWIKLFTLLVILTIQICTFREFVRREKMENVKVRFHNEAQ